MRSCGPCTGCQGHLSLAMSQSFALLHVIVRFAYSSILPPPAHASEHSHYPLRSSLKADRKLLSAAQLSGTGSGSLCAHILKLC